MNDKNNSKYYLPLLYALLLVIGILIGNKLNFHGKEASLFIYPQNNKLHSILNYIEEEYVDSIQKDELVEEVIPRLLEELDPHSVYIPAKDLQETNEHLHGAFDGIGVQFNLRDDTVIIIHPIPGGPSEKVGILAGDRIVTVDDSLIAGVGASNETVMSLLKGKKGTKVKVGIKRFAEEDLLPFIIIRDKIPIYSLDVAYMLDDETGYIKMNRFARSTYQEFFDAGEDLLDQGMKKLIVDLRGNSGGFMDMAIKMVDEFFDEGTLIVYTEGKARPRQETISTSKGRFKNTPIVVLIDEWSASASEIFAGAIQDNDRGIIVGRRSFGKGLVQEQREFADGSALRLTIARYYTPTGRSIQKPYVNGRTDEIANFHQNIANFDSINKEESKKETLKDTISYLTPKGKILYGGGGINPDIIIDPDTSEISNYYMRVRNRGLIYQFGFQYADKNRNRLIESKDYKKLLERLQSEDLLADFVKFAQEKGINPVNEDLKQSERILRIMIHAQIARNIFDDKSYYPIIQEIDEILMAGKKAFI